MGKADAAVKTGKPNAGTKGKPEAEAPEKVVRVRVPFLEWLQQNQPTLVNEEGKIGTSNTEQHYYYGDHKPPKAEDFETEDMYLDWRANEAERDSEKLARTAARFRAEAEAFRKFGDPAKRKAAQKVLKMREALKALEEQLAADGITLDEEGTES